MSTTTNIQLSKKDQKELLSLDEKLTKTNIKLQKLQAKQADIRSRIDLLLSKNSQKSIKLTDDLGTATTYTRQTNLSVPKAGAIIIKANLDKELFDNLFTTSYKIKAAVYNAMDSDSPNKKIVDKQLVVKSAPLKVAIKET